MPRIGYEVSKIPLRETKNEIKLSNLKYSDVDSMIPKFKLFLFKYLAYLNCAFHLTKSLFGELNRAIT